MTGNELDSFGKETQCFGWNAVSKAKNGKRLIQLAGFQLELYSTTYLVQPVVHQDHDRTNTSGSYDKNEFGWREISLLTAFFLTAGLTRNQHYEAHQKYFSPITFRN